MLGGRGAVCASKYVSRACCYLRLGCGAVGEVEVKKTQRAQAARVTKLLFATHLSGNAMR